MIDPTRDEMLAAIAAAELDMEPIDREAAIYWFASHWHGGQWSNLYRALSGSEYRPGLREHGPNGFDAERAYHVLERAFLPRAMHWAVSTETVTDESAQDGEAAATDYMSGLTFREAVQRFLNADREGGIEADSYPVTRATAPRWFTAYGGRDYRTGDFINASLHVPEHVTPASRVRLARLLGVPVRD